MVQPILSTNNLAIGYQNRRQTIVLADELELTLHAGELVCLLGPNGAGKSTLLRTLTAMQPSLGGSVKLNGLRLESIRPAEIAKRLSVVLTEKTDTGLLPAYGVVALGRYPYTDWRGRLSAEDEKIVQGAMTAVGAAELAHRPVIELSDGERQKVMIARALAQEPQLMVLDEPTAYLDLPRRIEIMQILRRLAHAGDRAVLLSTHDLDLALRNADKIWLLNDGVIEQGTPEDLVLSGSFARAFAAQGVRFDVLTGSFHLDQPAGARLALQGGGAERVWTQRALERAGYRLVEPGQAAPININCYASVWEIKFQELVLTATSIEELLATLCGLQSL